jgi:hypothetical protein
LKRAGHKQATAKRRQHFFWLCNIPFAPRIKYIPVGIKGTGRRRWRASRNNALPWQKNLRKTEEISQKKLLYASYQ